jgi:hypothetical protein
VLQESGQGKLWASLDSFEESGIVPVDVQLLGHLLAPNPINDD